MVDSVPNQVHVTLLSFWESSWGNRLERVDRAHLRLRIVHGHRWARVPESGFPAGDQRFWRFKVASRASVNFCFYNTFIDHLDFGGAGRACRGRQCGRLMKYAMAWAISSCGHLLICPMSYRLYGRCMIPWGEGDTWPTAPPLSRGLYYWFYGECDIVRALHCIQLWPYRFLYGHENTCSNAGRTCFLNHIGMSRKNIFEFSMIILGVIFPLILASGRQPQFSWSNVMARLFHYCSPFVFYRCCVSACFCVTIVTI